MIKRSMLVVGVIFSVAVSARAGATEPLPAKVTVLARQGTLVIDRALIDGDELLVPKENVDAITGFELKSQGLCAGEVCIPIPSGAQWLTERDDTIYFNVSRFAQKVDQVFARDAEHNVWSFTAVPTVQTSPLMAGEAPDFTLPDRTGKIVRLSDFRGKKVLILTWASWCGCRFDLAGWQKVYDALKGRGFEIIAAAQDTGGLKAADVWYDKADVTYTALIDVNHTVSSLYQMVNVPTGVWVDEKGKIVRPAEVAYSKQQRVLNQLIGDDRYATGLADWVEKGPQSVYILPPERLQQRLAVRGARERLADAYFKLGAYFSDQGNRDLATRHWQESQRLSPDNWNYHRQDWSFDKTKEMANFLGKVRKLGSKPYYDPVEFPEAKPEPAP
jgi:peroxiredoxin